ncbi:GNAT family N-acetyltransferase [Ornithinimicrobium cavernae]|uniref:GNAT family N-acetyltransferase n=1 Tax=Ornithinimicrobium cavernae TaxID=2666047 RepID=UPI000D69CAF5|nr:GNAT family N-acetyltransferase [Ornithinimicrobium cavernae]
MATHLGSPDVEDLAGVVAVLREWQDDGTPFQLHPGDLGWFWRYGAGATAAAVRTWRRGGQTLAVGLLDGADLLRVAIAPEAHQDDELAAQLVADLSSTEHGVLPPGKVALEVPPGALLHRALVDAGWSTDEPWTPLRRGLEEPVEDPALRIEEVGPERAPAWAAVHRLAFGGSLTEEVVLARWHAMSAGQPFADARCLLAHDEDDNAVAAVIVWSAGPGRPGLIEPLGTHPEHRGHGYGRAVTLAGAAALRELGSSAVLVATPSANQAAVAAYRSAGFDSLPERLDLSRDAS